MLRSTTIRTRASFDPCLLCIPPISKTCANSFFDRSFVYAAPTLWNAIDLDIRWSPKCAANTGVGVDMRPHCFIKCPNGLASYTASGSKSKLYLLAVGLFALTEIDERRISGA